MSIILKPRIKLIAGQATTTTLVIAEHFDKEHNKIVRDIADMCTVLTSNFVKENFFPQFLTDRRGREIRGYVLTEAGFSMVAMGFTGERALKWKEAYIETFKAMRKALSPQEDPDYTRMHVTERNLIYKQLCSAEQRNMALQAEIKIMLGKMYDLEQELKFRDMADSTGGHDKDDNEYRIKFLRLLYEHRKLNIATLKERTIVVADQNRASMAEVILKLTYALSATEAAILWVLFHKAVNNSFRCSIAGFKAFLDPFITAECAIKAARDRLLQRGFITMVRGPGSSASWYKVDLDRVVDAVQRFELKFLNDEDARIRVPGVTGINGEVDQKWVAKRLEMVSHRDVSTVLADFKMKNELVERPQIPKGLVGGSLAGGDAHVPTTDLEEKAIGTHPLIARHLVPQTPRRLGGQRK